MFEPQRAVFEKQYRVIAYDHRAQGQSEDIGRGYDMSTIADDAALLIRALEAAPCHFAGLSMGGFAGIARGGAPSRTDTNAHSDEHHRDQGKSREPYQVRISGPDDKAVQPRAIHADCRQRALWAHHPPQRSAASHAGTVDRETACTPAQYCPILAGGRESPPVPGGGDGRNPLPHARHYRRRRHRPSRQAISKSMLAGIRGARHVNISGAGHSSSLETPEAVTAAMHDLLQTAMNAVP